MKKNLYKEKTDRYSVKLEKEEPELYQVMLLQDDFTTMEFVLQTLERFFYMERQKAAEVMLEAKQEGQAVCGLFTKDVAATKIAEVRDFAMRHEFPLVLCMEAA